MGRLPKKPLVLKMGFAEALQRFIGVDPKEMASKGTPKSQGKRNQSSTPKGKGRAHPA